jgi:hypothetical protein
MYPENSFKNQPMLSALDDIDFRLQPPYDKPSVVLCYLCSLNFVGCYVSTN